MRGNGSNQKRIPQTDVSFLVYHYLIVLDLTQQIPPSARAVVCNPPCNPNHKAFKEKLLFAQACEDCSRSSNYSVTMTSSTTFVFVPGAWHPASAIDPVAKPLSAAGYAVRGVDLPSVGAEPPLDGFGPDVDAISKVIAEEADKGQDVVLFMHSYGGVVGTEACRGLGKKDREAAGKKGGVIRLIYCTAFMVGEGEF